MIVLAVVSLVYTALIFRKDLQAVKITKDSVAFFRPRSAIRNKKVLTRGTPILIVAILLMISKEWIGSTFGITLDNATISLTAAFFAMLLFHRDPKKVFSELIDWEIIFFFMGLFIIVGALEFTQVIDLLALALVRISQGNIQFLTGLIAVGSTIISTFIDNVPYNITLVGAIQAMEKNGLWVYPLWWALNLGTSIGGAGSPIGAACNVIAFGQIHREGHRPKFGYYLKIAVPLILLNGCITFAIISLRYFL